VKTRLIIIGAGGLGREVASIVENLKDFDLKGYIDDDPLVPEVIKGYRVLGKTDIITKEMAATYSFVLAIGNPRAKEKIINKLKGFDLKFPNIVHSGATIQDKGSLEIGKGNIICNGTILTTDIQIGDFNLLNLLCTVGHNVRIENYCSIMPSVNISGGVHLKDLVYIGTGAKLIKSARIDKGAVIGAGAVINSNVESYATYVGIPGKKITNGG
jgi:sugar O-acyltransferase (sialic acid O-acetyltransferase NeuD family)